MFDNVLCVRYYECMCSLYIMHISIPGNFTNQQTSKAVLPFQIFSLVIVSDYQYIIAGIVQFKY